MTSKDHNKLIGIFLLIHGGFQMLIMVIVMLIYGGIGAALTMSAKGDDKFVGVAFFIAILFVVVISAVILLPQIIGGWMMFKEKPNAKIWGIIGSILALFSIPFGTAAGVYGLWFLFGDEGKYFYDGGNQMISNNPPPPPNSWQ